MRITNIITDFNNMLKRKSKFYLKFNLAFKLIIIYMKAKTKYLLQYIYLNIMYKLIWFTIFILVYGLSFIR